MKLKKTIFGNVKIVLRSKKQDFDTMLNIVDAVIKNDLCFEKERKACERIRDLITLATLSNRYSTWGI